MTGNWAKRATLCGAILIAIEGAAFPQSTSSTVGRIEIGSEQFVILKISDSNSRNAEFNRDLAEYMVPGQIPKCEILIDVPVGSRDGNNSYGAYCTYRVDRRQIRIEICDDEMLGHFKLSPVAWSGNSTSDLAKFVADNCFGG